MSKIHKARIVLSRWAANSSGQHSEYKVCGCDYGQDHDDFRSISGQNTEIYPGFGEAINDMLRVARREKWHFSPKELEHTKHWLMSSGDFKDGKLQPQPFAQEIIKLIDPAPKPVLGNKEEK